MGGAEAFGRTDGKEPQPGRGKDQVDDPYAEHCLEQSDQVSEVRESSPIPCLPGRNSDLSRVASGDHNGERGREHGPEATL